MPSNLFLYIALKILIRHWLSRELMNKCLHCPKPGPGREPAIKVQSFIAFTVSVHVLFAVPGVLRLQLLSPAQVQQWLCLVHRSQEESCHMKVHAPGEYCFCSGPVICMDRWLVFQEDLALGSLHKLCEEVAMVRACRASQETTHNLYWHHLQNPVPKFSATECDTQAGDFSYGEFYMITMARSPLCVVSPDSSVSSGGLFSSV